MRYVELQENILYLYECISVDIGETVNCLGKKMKEK